ncbi:DUF948 domain-containing protein [Paenibacillus radicis (ex Xue et al. 2023)]|uniref:DUF948 domain-containing protein n=1 Tax=Paenibacillus radicis (ex Xue et al. 2023) TaxID=2972489 RepID=A0ABT1YGE9_9BACL|nr:DUF948 domain-containing protein [Paenibacillus radicis (ex Xue et al. 2023)]MCR8631035.1 DUF948 domain-containing protein [Paenibacillus radicis (ex Xue et al. 2023)]
MLWQIAVLIVSIAVVVLIGFLIPTLIETRRTIKETYSTLSQLQMKLEQTAVESKQLIQLTQQVVEDVQERIKAANGFVEAMEQTGAAASRLSQSVKLVSRTLSDTVTEASSTLHSNKDTMRDILELTSISMQLWQRWQDSKSSKAKAQTNEQQ